MIIDAKVINESNSFKTDVCIFGCGIAGIVLANELLNKNISVIVLESGDEIYEQQTQDLYKAEAKPDIFPPPSSSRLRFLGGTSNHWENSVERFDPIDFQKRSWVTDSGWPISYDDVAKYYPDAEQYCGVGREGFNIEYWKDKLSFHDIFSTSKIFETAVSKTAIPPTRFFQKYGDDLVKNPNIRIFKNANVTDIDFDSENKTVNSAMFRALNKPASNIKANVFIMCLGGIENARMLLTFNEKYDNILGNQFDNVGRYFMEHPTIRAAHFYPLDNKLNKIYNGVLDDSNFIHGRGKLNESAQYKHQTNNLRLYFTERTKLDLSHGISSSHILADSLSNYEIPDDFGSHLVNALKDIDLISEAYLRKSFNTSIIDDANEFYGYQIISMIEQTPDRSNRITLGNERDVLNIKKINIDFNISNTDKESAWRSLELLAKDPVLHPIGRIRLLKLREDRIWKSQLGFSHHHIGTTRMAHRIEDGVVDSCSKVFNTNNLYISGSSVFPTGGHVPPTLTIVAMAIKLANDIKQIL
jgi:choline dehydrogenase-like flavoprotein